MGLPRRLSGKESACQCRRCRFNPWIGKNPWSRKWQPTPVFSPGESHAQSSLVSYGPWGHKELHTAEWLSMRIQIMLKKKKRDHPGGSDLRMRGLWKHRASLDSHKEEVRDQKQEKYPKYYCWLDNGEACVVRSVGSLHLQRPAMSCEAARKWGPQFYSPKKMNFVNNWWAWKRMLASDENLIPS